MTRSGTEISVVIATYNRAALLAGALQSLAKQTLDPSLFEIVVDHAVGLGAEARTGAGAKHGQ
jgi:GT2 family glycosyltransferase